MLEDSRKLAKLVSLGKEFHNLAGGKLHVSLLQQNQTEIQ